MSNKILEINEDELEEISEETVTLIESMWKDSGFRLCFQKRNLYQLPDSTR